MSKTTRKISTFVVFSLFALICSCTIAERDDTLTDVGFPSVTYSKLNVSNAISVKIDSTTDEIHASIAQSIKDRIVVELKGTDLHIRLKDRTISKSPITVTLPVNERLQDIELSGASSFSSEFPLSLDKIDIDLSGASSIDATIYTRDLDLELSGASAAKISGGSNQMDLELSGASKLSGNSFSVNYADVDISGASTATFGCSSSISGDVSGNSTIYYIGSPRINVKTSGNSQVNPL